MPDSKEPIKTAKSILTDLLYIIDECPDVFNPEDDRVNTLRDDIVSFCDDGDEISTRSNSDSIAAFTDRFNTLREERDFECKKELLANEISENTPVYFISEKDVVKVFYDVAKRNFSEKELEEIRIALNNNNSLNAVIEETIEEVFKKSLKASCKS